MAHPKPVARQKSAAKAPVRVARKVAPATGRSHAVARGAEAAARVARTGKAAKPRATTVRLAPELQAGLELLQGLLKKPVNKLVNEALKGFIARRATEVQSDLEGVLARIHAYRRKDPDFAIAMRMFVAAEAQLGATDPAEGTVSRAPSEPVGPAQAMVRTLLNR